MTHLLNQHHNKKPSSWTQVQGLGFLRFSMLGATTLVCVGSCVLACEHTSKEQPQAGAVVAEAKQTPPTAAAPAIDLCAQRAEQLRGAVQRDGTPVLDRHRAELLGRARAVPLVFGTSPLLVTATVGSSAEDDFVIEQRKKLFSTQQPVQDIQEILRKTRGNHALRRRIFLSQQYMYAETPLLALRMSQVLRLDHLFNEDEVVIRRGSQQIIAHREDGRYFLPDESPEGSTSRKKQHGALASLLLFDQVKTREEEWLPRIGHDLRPVQRELGFDAARVQAATEQGWVMALSTRGVESTVVLQEQTDGEFVLECESAPQFDALLDARKQNLREAELIAPIIGAAHEIIARALPFDEPRTEEGQQDGLLRIHFRKAYRSYQSTYEFNGDSYYVFDGFGRPRLPEVCIDFITDAFDWGTGGYWPVRGEKRLQRKGALNFSSFGIENPRSVENLAEFATATPQWFDMLWIPKEEQVKFLHREDFFAALAATAERYRRGDVVFIYGLRDDEKFHYHSFMIDEKDPLTGMPMVVLANAGPPQARSWEGEMQNAPLRKIVARMRVRPSVLEQALRQQQDSPGVPLEAPRRSEKSAEQALPLEGAADDAVPTE